eukprot:COSAG02_NODE_273_length_26316_cov_13.661060_18_plen_52_part_00
MMIPGSMMTTAMKICFNSMPDHHSTHSTRQIDLFVHFIPWVLYLASIAASP